jgi:hypothetical protein
MVTATPDSLTFRLHDVHGAVVYENVKRAR